MRYFNLGDKRKENQGDAVYSGRSCSSSLSSFFSSSSLHWIPNFYPAGMKRDQRSLKIRIVPPERKSIVHAQDPTGSLATRECPLIRTYPATSYKLHTLPVSHLLLDQEHAKICHQVSATRHQLPGISHQALATRHQLPGISSPSTFKSPSRHYRGWRGSTQ